MDKSWLNEQVKIQISNKVKKEKKEGILTKKRLYRIWIKDKYRWDLWADDFRVVIAYSEEDAALKFKEIKGFDEWYYIDGIEEITLSDIKDFLVKK